MLRNVTIGTTNLATGATVRHDERELRAHRAGGRRSDPAREPERAAREKRLPEGGGANRCVECDARGGKKTRDNASVTTTRFDQENRATT